MIDISGEPEYVKNKIAEMIGDDTLKIINQKSVVVSANNTIYTKYIKRVIDVIVSIIALIIFLPLNVVLACVVFFDVGRPILFSQDRIGKNGIVFRVYKFRSMTNRTDENGELLSPQSRVTKIGKVIRKMSLDEFLNFYSILKGEMSLIGPRPLLVKYGDRFSSYHNSRHLVRPGLECPLLKTQGKNNITWDDRLNNDVWYVENCSFLTDIKLFFRVVEMVFDKKSARVRSEAKMGAFLGYDYDGTVISSYTVPDRYKEKIDLIRGNGLQNE